MKDKNITRYSRASLPKGKTRWEKIKTMSDKDVEAAAKSDSENPRWTKKMLETAFLRPLTFKDQSHK